MSAPRDAAAIRKATVVRFFVVHLLAYAIALPWGMAAIPAVFVWRESELLALGDERDAVHLVVKLALVPALLAFLVPHGLGAPWVLAARHASRRGWLLFVTGNLVLFAGGSALAVVAWLRVLQP